MKHILKFILIAVAMVIAIPTFAVTDREMEAARALAAKHYLRYANNGSDYLDNLNPSTVGELSGKLKAKEKENIKSFNAVTVPKDYASWDKDQLVKYWSVTFFKSPGLLEDGKKCLGVLAGNLRKLEVGAPAAAEAPKSETPEPQTAAEASPAPQEPAVSAPAAADTAAGGELEAVADADAGVEEETPRQSSNTGWYVAILVVLIIVVIWLVMYASKSMKESGDAAAVKKDSDREIRESKVAAKEEVNKLREQYAASLAAKNDEIKQLKADRKALEDEIEQLRGELSREQSRSAARAASAAQSRAPQRQEPSQTAPEQPRQRASALPPVVYLGYVNQRGLFVKASRSLNPDSSVYRMDIPDGHHGTFTVVSDPAVLDRVLSDIGTWLEGGCEIENPQDADIANEIMTLQPGEAVFADNTCRVTRKARIKFI